MSLSLDDLVKVAYEVRSAIRHAGPNPNHHWQTMERHRKEWPTLWKALDDLLVVIEGEQEKSKGAPFPSIDCPICGRSDGHHKWDCTA